jgi:hypothetical protein
MGCEESFITMKLHWHSYLVFSIGSCAHEIETDLTPTWELQGLTTLVALTSKFC